MKWNSTVVIFHAGYWCHSINTDYVLIPGNLHHAGVQCTWVCNAMKTKLFDRKWRSSSPVAMCSSLEYFIWEELSTSITPFFQHTQTHWKHYFVICYKYTVWSVLTRYTPWNALQILKYRPVASLWKSPNSNQTPEFSPITSQ